MDTTSTVIAIASIVIAASRTLLALWLRLLWRTRLEQARHRCLLGAARTLGPGARLDLDADHGPGDRLRLTITPAPTCTEDPAA
ncbi:hypothetical protein Slala03_65350 [Streptomyces lavendulae subsp. lavendulae]|uniref:hypothetical protein n=1 Tax=Streptomyces lavendulae TaxID=1914 RepID=UPI0024A19647|nr:hypothetical protein [Streptomyces lavendulae]GLV86846.1 hypothetical protein Slala03_65350 [Streptomyces lavendulae subsp. lavendulae]